MNKPTVFITGATGFLGSHLACLLLRHGYKVIAMKKSSSSIELFHQIHQFHQLPKAYQPNWVLGDILDIDDLTQHTADVEIVFHCAAMVSFNRKDKQQLMANNVLGTRNVVNACLHNRVPNLIYASSVAAIGRNETNQVINENTAWVESKFNSQYAISKFLAEQEVWRGNEEGLNVGMVNPGIILGFGNGVSGSNQLYRMIHGGQPLYPIGGNGFVGVEDVSKMMLSLFENKLWGKRFICVSENIKYKQLFIQLSNAMGKKQPHIPIQGFTYFMGLAITKTLEALSLPCPIPSENIITSSQDSQYESIHGPLLPDFQYTPIRAVNYYALLALGLLNKESTNQNN